MNQEKTKTITTFKKAVGTINKVVEMIEDEKYCIDIMQQNLAAIGLLKSAQEALLTNHLKTCFVSKIKNATAKEQGLLIEEILKIIRFNQK